MEDTLRAVTVSSILSLETVLILVLMEDTLRVCQAYKSHGNVAVLILVLMEDTLRAVLLKCANLHIVGLNPCFNGRYSQSRKP